MSCSLRPVEEIWGPATSCFIRSAHVVRLIEIVAERVITHINAEPYGDVMAVWIEDGRAFLDYIWANPGFCAESIGDEIDSSQDGVTFGTDRPFDPVADMDELRSLIASMRDLAVQWRESVNEDGALRIYVDMY